MKNLLSFKNLKENNKPPVIINPVLYISLYNVPQCFLFAIVLIYLLCNFSIIIQHYTDADIFISAAKLFYNWDNNINRSFSSY